VKRRDLERRLRAQGARFLREGGNHTSGASTPSARLPFRATVLQARAQDLHRPQHPAAERAAITLILNEDLGAEGVLERPRELGA